MGKTMHKKGLGTKRPERALKANQRRAISTDVYEAERQDEKFLSSRAAKRVTKRKFND